MAQYEFTATENTTIGKLAGCAALWGAISVGAGGWQAQSAARAVLAHHVALLPHLLAGVVSLIVGVTFLAASRPLVRIVRTQGSDVTHMMSALERLAAALAIQAVATVTGFALGYVLDAVGMR